MKEDRFEKFIKDNTVQNKITIFVTHDYFVAFLEYHFYKKIYEGKIKVDFLAGISI